jgi:excinuclease ABC subunit C
MRENETNDGFLGRGRNVILSVVKDLPDTPGVYRMLDDKKNVLYVGKAKRLKRRVMNYTQVDRLPMRLKRMVSDVVTMEIVHTHTEVEALLLESNLIKKLRPRYNILLRDDKSFPYLFLDERHDFPRLSKYRGKRDDKKGAFYGPFASAGAVNETIDTLQKAFLLRNCSDYDFSTRTRPCLQFHIKKCTAPCINMVSKNEYRAQISDLKPFLEGKSGDVKDRLNAEMMHASKMQDFEKAALLRDRVKALTSLQSRQDINIEGVGDVDVVVCAQDGHYVCVQVFFFRAGQNFGNRSYFPQHTDGATSAEVLSAFLGQFYQDKPVPKQVLLNATLEDEGLLADALSKNAGYGVSITTPQKGDKRKIVIFAYDNACQALGRYIKESMRDGDALQALVPLFCVVDVPNRIEVYDNSHTGGTNMVGGMVVASPDGFQKHAYRKFNIKHADASDDYGMMREVIERRFHNVDCTDSNFPDVLLIDGGKGQLSAVREVLVSLGIFDHLCVVAISKGPDRNAGREEFHMDGREVFTLPHNNSTLHYLQKLRDEAHRFAISSHRVRRKNSMTKSGLDLVSGVGSKKKKALLHYFGSLKEIQNAGVEDLKKVDGISNVIAQTIYDTFHHHQ